MCWHVQNNCDCPFLDQCNYAHNEEELRTLKKRKFDQDTPLPDTTNWKFVFSGVVDNNQKNLCLKFVNNLGCQGITNVVDSSVTHVVVMTGDNLRAKRTFKFLKAVSSGVRIVSFLWVEACLKDKDNLNKADNWEALDEKLNGANGPFRSRKGREEGKKPLLAGLEVLIDGSYEDLHKQLLEDLLFRAGAKTVSGVNMFSSTPGIMRLVLVNNVSEYGQKEVTRMLRSFRLAVVDKGWLLDTVSSYSRRPVQQYTLKITAEEFESEEDNDESESMEIIENYRSRYGRVVKKNPKYVT